MNRVHIQPGAVADVDEAAGWYEKQRAGLGIEFVLEFDAAVGRVTESPGAYAVQHRDVRRILLRRFPYAAYFTFEDHSVEVFAVLHQKKPGSDRGR